MASQAWCQREGVRNKTWILGFILMVMYRIVEFVSDTLFGLYYSRNQKLFLPAFEDPLLIESASSLAFKIRTKKVTSEEVVKAFIKRINAVNPIINCVVDNRFELALEEARAVDKIIQSGEKNEITLEYETPFLGVPFTIKDCFAVKGLRWTSGLVRRKNLVAEFDSDVIVHMKKAGGIMLAITNVPELCMWWESHNCVYGRSRNPYDTNRIVGGSSGGEGGLLTAGGSPFGIGSDIAGSIRMPAFFNGIFGHKPTSGIVSNSEHWPPVAPLLQTYLVTGPMSRFCSDLLPMYRVLAAENVSKLKLDTKVSLSKVRFFYIENLGKRVPLISPVHPDLKKAQMEVINYIQKTFNVPVQKVSFPKLQHAFVMWFVKLTTGGNPPLVVELAMRKGEISIIGELIKSCLGRSNHTFFSIFSALCDKYSLPSTHPAAVEVISMCDELNREIQELLGDDGVLFVPPSPSPAVYHNQTLTRPFNPTYTAIFNMLGLPVTQVPLGLGSWGLPLGVQVVANMYNDHLTLAVAAELEKAFGGWVPPSPVYC